MLFFGGGLLYMVVAVADLEEAGHAGYSFEWIMNMLYLIGGFFYLVATFIFVPAVTDFLGKYSAQLYGSWGFIVGSLFFVMACFLNGAHTGDTFTPAACNADPVKAKYGQILVLGTTNATMIGSILFLVGSVLYLPDIGCSEETVTIGTWCYLIGSVHFVVSGILPVVRKRTCAIEHLCTDHEKEQFLAVAHLLL